MTPLERNIWSAWMDDPTQNRVEASAHTLMGMWEATAWIKRLFEDGRTLMGDPRLNVDLVSFRVHDNGYVTVVCAVEEV